MPDSFEILVNEEPVKVRQGTSVSQLLEQIHMLSPAIAVEVNHSLVTRQEQATYELRPGDQIEIVTLVGGG